MNEIELAYVAGLFDGEGSAATRMVKAHNEKRYAKLDVRIAQVDRTVLDWLVSKFGFGKVYPKYDKRTVNNSGWNECYDYKVSYKAGRIFLTAIEPYLIVKKDKVKDLLDFHGREN